MSNYRPKVNDKVQATLGDSIIVGVVVGVFVGRSSTSDRVQIGIQGSEYYEWFSTTEWKFKKLAMLPYKLGAIIQARTEASGFVTFLARSGPGEWCTVPGLAIWTDLDVLKAHSFEVLYEGIYS